MGDAATSPVSGTAPGAILSRRLILLAAGLLLLLLVVASRRAIEPLPPDSDPPGAPAPVVPSPAPCVRVLDADGMGVPGVDLVTGPLPEVLATTGEAGRACVVGVDRDTDIRPGGWQAFPTRARLGDEPTFLVGAPCSFELRLSGSVPPEVRLRSGGWVRSLPNGGPVTVVAPCAVLEVVWSGDRNGARPEPASVDARVPPDEIRFVTADRLTFALAAPDGSVPASGGIDGGAPDVPPNTWYRPAGFRECVHAQAPGFLDRAVCGPDWAPDDDGIVRIVLEAARTVHLRCDGGAGVGPCPSGISASCTDEEGTRGGSCSVRRDPTCNCPHGSAVVTGTGPDPWRVIRAPVVGDAAIAMAGSSQLSAVSPELDACALGLIYAEGGASTLVFGATCEQGVATWRGLVPGTYSVVSEDEGGGARRYGPFVVEPDGTRLVTLQDPPAAVPIRVDVSTLDPPLRVEMIAPGWARIQPWNTGGPVRLDGPPGAVVKICDRDGGCSLTVPADPASLPCPSDPAISCTSSVLEWAGW